MWQAIFLLSWGGTFFEYCLAVPANRIGSETFSKYQLKITQEVITLVVFTVYMCWVFGEWPKWNHIVSFVLILAAVVFAFLPTQTTKKQDELPFLHFRSHYEKEAQGYFEEKWVRGRLVGHGPFPLPPGEGRRMYSCAG